MQKSPPRKGQPATRRQRGFEAAGVLLTGRIRRASEKRGFALTRLLTRWEEIAGPDISAMAQPVELRHGRSGGLGATLTLLTTGAHAPVLEMQKPTILQRVNACYGYPAVSRVRITQTAATGFSEGQASFRHGSAKPSGPAPGPDPAPAARRLTDPIVNDDLRAALDRLARNVLSRDR